MRASRFYLKTAFEQWIFAKSVSAWTREAANGGQRAGKSLGEIRSWLIVWLWKTQGFLGWTVWTPFIACQAWDLNRTNRELEEAKNNHSEMKWNSDCQMSDWLPNQLFSSRVPRVLRIYIFLFTGLISCSFSTAKQKPQPSLGGL